MDASPRRLTDRAQAAGDPPAGARVVDVSPCPPGHNTPLPLERSPPDSFKRLLGGGRPESTHESTSTCKMTLPNASATGACNGCSGAARQVPTPDCCYDNLSPAQRLP